VTRGPALDPTGGLARRPWSDVVKIAASRFMRNWGFGKPKPTKPLEEQALNPPQPGPAVVKQVSAHELVEMFTRKIFSVNVTTPGEWRRWKKDHRCRR